jgi:hypothetical protein
MNNKNWFEQKNQTKVEQKMNEKIEQQLNKLNNNNKIIHDITGTWALCTT